MPKICTMNCGPALGDSRTQEQRQKDCTDCQDHEPWPDEVIEKLLARITDQPFDADDISRARQFLTLADQVRKEMRP